MNTYPNRTYLSLVVLLSACVFVSAGSVSFAPCKGTSSIKWTGPDAKGPDILEAFRHYNKTKITSLSFTNVKDMDDAAMKEILEIVASLQPSTITTLQLQTLPLFESLPDSIGQLPNLTTLTMTHLPLFESLPDSIGELAKLETLTMADLLVIESLPDSFGGLAKLETLTMTHLPLIESLPQSMSGLTELTTLTMTQMGGLKTLRTGSITIGSSKLIKLELHANQIEEIEADAIQVAPSGSLNRTIVNLF